jgi:hypothetical protein
MSIESCYNALFYENKRVEFYSEKVKKLEIALENAKKKLSGSIRRAKIKEKNLNAAYKAISKAKLKHRHVEFE